MNFVSIFIVLLILILLDDSSFTCAQSLNIYKMTVFLIQRNQFPLFYWHQVFIFIKINFCWTVKTCTFQTKGILFIIIKDRCLVSTNRLSFCKLNIIFELNSLSSYRNSSLFPCTRL